MAILNDSSTNTYHGNIYKIPFGLLQYVATTGECPEQRREREQREESCGVTAYRPVPGQFYYGVYDTVEHFVKFYFGFPSARETKFRTMLNRIFAGVLVPWSGNQVINTRGNGLCAYNCLYMFLSITRPDILELFDSGKRFAEFKSSVRDMAIQSLDPDIRDFMTPLVDDPSTPDLDPIFTAFVDFTEINILMISINDNSFTWTKTKFSHRDYPSDHIVIIRKACHLMYLQTNSNYTHRQQMYQLIDSNCS